MRKAYAIVAVLVCGLAYGLAVLYATASYPSAAKSFTTKTDGPGQTIFAAHINDLQDEVVAIENALLSGFTHLLKPTANATYDLGTSSLAWRNLYVSGTTKFNGITYTWPAADGSSGQTLTTNGSATLSWTSASAIGRCDLRLSLTSGTFITTADVTAATSVFVTPTPGAQCSFYDGSTAWNQLSGIAEVTVAVPATTSQMYDVYCFNSSGTMACDAAVAWTNDTTRATALAKQNSVYVKTGTTTRRYIGSFRTTTVSGQTEDSKALRYVWSYYNRVPRQLEKVQAGNTTWNYTVATIRQANNGTGTLQVDAVIGVAEALCEVTLQTVVTNTNSVNVQIGIGVDSTTTFGTNGGFIVTGTTTNALQVGARYVAYPAVGKHTYSWNEWSQAVGTTSWNNSAASSNNASGGLSGSCPG